MVFFRQSHPLPSTSLSALSHSSFLLLFLLFPSSSFPPFLYSFPVFVVSHEQARIQVPAFSLPSFQFPLFLPHFLSLSPLFSFAQEGYTLVISGLSSIPLPPKFKYKLRLCSSLSLASFAPEPSPSVAVYSDSYVYNCKLTVLKYVVVVVVVVCC